MVKGTCTYASDEESAERNYQRIRPYCKLHSLITDSCSYVFLCSCDIGAMVFISLKTKKSEIIAGILIAIFLVTLNTTLMI